MNINMKTLDEVILEFERQEAFVKYYMQDKTQFRSDALYYLKTLQKIAKVCHDHGIKSLWGVMLPNPEETKGFPDLRGFDEIVK